MRPLRDWLIMTTSTVAAPEALAYLRSHMNAEMLTDLVQIALEGEDMGDAPWAAANVISEYPAELLIQHESQLREIAAEPWDYLNRPAKVALEKIAAVKPLA